MSDAVSSSGSPQSSLILTSSPGGSENYAISSLSQSPTPACPGGSEFHFCATRLLIRIIIVVQETSNDCSSAVIGVSAVSLLVIVTLITVILTQCLLILRMRRSRDEPGPYIEPSIHHVDVPTAPNEAYALHKIVKPRDDDTYEMVK